ncbi:hypothetical protein JCM12296A_57840 [Desulfosarcina cetonica]
MGGGDIDAVILPLLIEPVPEIIEIFSIEVILVGIGHLIPIPVLLGCLRIILCCTDRVCLELVFEIFICVRITAGKCKY